MNKTNQSITRRRVIALFWGVILFSTILVATEAFSAPSTYISSSSNGGTLEGEYVGAETCKMCHSDNYDSWSETGHATAAEVLSTDTNEECNNCHISNTVGGDYFEITATNEPEDQGVSCESCHGPYTSGMGAGHMPVTLSAELCTICHSPFHSWGHGNAGEAWSQSNHANAQQSLMELETEEPECVHCHTAEGALPWPLAGVDTITDTENSITCSVCHDPHSADHENNLREADSTDLCETCHEHQTSFYEGSRHEQKGAECSQCHMYGEAQDYQGEWIQVTNHTMFTWIGSCGQDGCHSDPEAAWAAKFAIQAEYADDYETADYKVTAAHEAFEEASTKTGVDPDLLAQAETKLEEIDHFWHDIGLAGSQGFHNPDEVTAAFDQLNQDCEEVIQLSQESVSEPSFPVLLILSMVSLGTSLLIAVLRRRRVK